MVSEVSIYAGDLFQDDPVLLRLTWFTSSSVSLLTNLFHFGHLIVFYFLVCGSKTQGIVCHVAIILEEDFIQVIENLQLINK